MSQHRIRGFSLTELLILIAVVAVLVGIALPSFHDYEARMKVSEGLRLAEGAKTSVEQYFLDNKRFPASNRAAQYSRYEETHGKYVADVEIGKGGQITVTFAKQAAPVAGATLIMTPSVDIDEGVVWRCDKGTLKQAYRPYECRSQDKDE